MQIRKYSLLKLCLGILLMGGLTVEGISGLTIGATTGIAEAAPLATCVIGTPCSSGIGVTVTGGTLTANTNSAVVNNGGAISVTGQDQTVPFKFLTSLTDARGTGIGWNISASATTLTFGAGGATSDLFLDPTTPVTVTCAANSTCSSPSALTLATGGTNLVTAPVTLVSAPIATGLGGFNIQTLGNFTVPASANAGAATGGAISITVSAAP